MKRRAIVVASATLAAALAATAAGFTVAHELRERKLERVKKDFLNLYVSIGAYGVDRCGVYNPPDTTLRLTSHDSLPTFETDVPFITTVPTGSDHRPIPFWQPLTTPVAYAHFIPNDPFRPGHTYSYVATNFHDQLPVVALLHSPGPDRDDDLNMRDFKKGLENNFARFGRFPSREIVKPVLRDMVLPSLYDPTNGTVSSGDLISVIYHNGRAFAWDYPNPEWLEAPQWTPERMREEEAQRGLTQMDGDPLPGPADTWLAILREEPVHIPRAVLDDFREAGIDPSKSPAQAGWETWIAGRGWIGKDFSTVILTGEWDSSFEANLNEWKTKAPQWWQMIEALANDSRITNTVEEECEVNRNTYYALLPVVGKSLYLYALSEEYRKNTVAADAATQALKNLAHFGRNDFTRADLYQHRVQTELGRLQGELYKLSTRQTVGGPTE